MFTIANRLRGTWSWMAKVTGILFGLLVILILPFTHFIGFDFGVIRGGIANDFLVGTLVAVMYIFGESMGWGKWIGGIISGHTKAEEWDLHEKEGTYNGIHLIANWIAPESEDYQHYCNVALSIRGFYWAFLTILPLLIFDYIGIATLLIFSILIGVGFPLSVMFGKYTSSRFNFEYGYLSIEGAWEHAEVWYGLVQDVSIISLIILIYKNIQI